MKTREDKIYNFFGHLVMTILTLLAIIPILLMFISSLTDNATLLQNGYSFLPEKWSTYAYEWVFTSSSSMVIKAYGMSFILTATGVVCSLALTTCLAYGLSKKGLPGRNVLTFLVFFTMLFNGGLVPTYINYTTVFHVKDTFFGLLVPSLMMSAFNVLLMKSYFVTGVPDEILEAAYIDGANEFQTMWKIAIPLSKPIITTVAMFSGIAYWNDWNNGYIYLTKRTDLYAIFSFCLAPFLSLTKASIIKIIPITNTTADAIDQISPVFTLLVVVVNVGGFDKVGSELSSTAKFIISFASVS